MPQSPNSYVYRVVARRSGIRLLAHRLDKLKTVLVPILVVAVMAAAATPLHSHSLVRGVHRRIPESGASFQLAPAVPNSVNQPER